MSNIIPPLLSSTPPPMSDTLDEEDEEFSEFAAAVNLSYGCDVLSLPTMTRKCSMESFSNNCHEVITNSIEIQNAHLSTTVEKDFQDKRKTDELNCCDTEKIDSFKNEEDNINNLFCSSSTNSDSKYSDFQYFPDIPPDILAETHSEIDIAVYGTLDNESNCEQKEDTNLDYDLEFHHCSTLEEEPSKIGINEANNNLTQRKQEYCDADLILESDVTVHNIQDVNKENITRVLKREADCQDCNTSHFLQVVDQQCTDDDDFGDFTNHVLEEVNVDIEHLNVSEDIRANLMTDESVAIKESNFALNFEENLLDNAVEYDFAHFSNIDHRSFDSVSKNVNIDDKVEDDDFGDFNNHSIQMQILPSTTQDSIEQLTEFQSASQTNFNIQPEKLKTVIVNMFPITEQLFVDYKYQDFTKSNSIFSELKDVTDTSALSYQWNKSNSQNVLLKALNIDTRNILYGPRWNESMPRYAATLGFAPLEPVKSDITASTTAETSSASPGQTTSPELTQHLDIPSAQFDWSGSGLTNPLEMTPKKIIETRPKEPKPVDSNPNGDIKALYNDFTPVSSKTNCDQESVKSLQLSDDIQLDEKLDKNEINSFQSSKNEDDVNFSNWPVPLRETHISTNDGNDVIEKTTVNLEESDWLKSTILTTILPEAENNSSKVEAEGEEFSEFQSRNHQANDMQSNTSTNKNSNEDDDDEFTDFQSISCTPTQLLQPSILQPTVTTNTATTINWPDPGVTDEDLTRIELFYKPNTVANNDIESSTVQSKTTPKNERSSKVTDEDDWSDFVSNRDTIVASPLRKTNPKITPNRTATPELQLCIPQLQEIQFPKKPAPVITQNSPIKIKPLVQTSVPQTSTYPQNGIQPSLISHQFAALNNVTRKEIQTDDFDDEWTDFVSSTPISNESAISNGFYRNQMSKHFDSYNPPQFMNWSTASTPNIITNPVSFDSFQSFANLEPDILKHRGSSIKSSNTIVQPKKSTVPSISTVPDLEFIAPKNKTWKK